MKVAGQLTVVIGLLFCGYAAFFQGVSVSGGFGEREIINIGLQQDRLLTFSFGLAALIVGAIFQVGGELLERLPSRFEPALDRSVARVTSTHGEPINDGTKPAPEHQSERIEDEMARLGVVAQGDKYVFGNYRYDRLEDALAYAKSRRP